MAQPLNEYTVNGKQIFNLFGIGNPDAVPPVPLTPLITTVIDPTGFDTNGSAETWANTHTTITRTKSVNSLSNPQILAVEKAILVCNNNTVPTASIGIEADNSGGIGTYFGMNLYNNNSTDFGITSTFPYQGSVVFDQEGVGSTTTTTAIKQGLITITDPTVPLVTSFNATTLTSGATSATWADIISGSAGSNTLQEVLTAGNVATLPVASFGINNSITNLSTNVFSGSVDCEFDDGITAQLTSYSYNSVGSSGSLSVSSTGDLTLSGNNLVASPDNLKLLNPTVGNTTTPSLILENTSLTAGTTNGVPSIETDKSGRNGANNDLISTFVNYAKNYAGVKTLFTKIESNIRNTALGNDDGSIGIFATLNGVMTEFFRFNGSDGENNSFVPLDMNNQVIKTSTGKLEMNGTASTGSGQVVLTPKATSNVNVNGDLLMTTDKTITLNDSSPNAVQTVIGNGKVLVNDVTNSLSTFQDQSTFGIQNGTPTTTLYDISGFACNDNSIQCNSSNGFYMNYGSAVNYTQLDLDTFEMYNTGGTLIDQITMGNNGTGNPVFNLLSTDNTNPSPLLKQAGISNQSIGFTYTDVSTGGSTNLQLTNNTGGQGQLSYTNAIDPSQLLSISSNCTIEISTTQDLQLTGTALQSVTSSGSASQYLRIKLNGTFYKIALDND